MLPYKHYEKILAEVFLPLPFYLLCIPLSLQWPIFRIGITYNVAFYTGIFMESSLIDDGNIYGKII